VGRVDVQESSMKTFHGFEAWATLGQGRLTPFQDRLLKQLDTDTRELLARARWNGLIKADGHDFGNAVT